MFLKDEPLSPPVVTFTFVQPTEASMTEFVHHLGAYLPLFRQLSAFHFLYLARTDAHFRAASEMFDSLVTIPLRSNATSEIVRYFEVRKAWDLKQYSALSEADLIFRNNAKSRFPGERFEHLYRAWKAGRLPESSIRHEFGGDGKQHAAHFAAQLLLQISSANVQSGPNGVQGAEIASAPASSPVSAPPDPANSVMQGQMERS